jgi:hypothetical protein
LLAFAIVPDMARTDTWVAFQGHDASARMAAGWWLAWCVIRAILGGIVLVYVGGMFNKRIRSGEFERIAEDDMLAGKSRVKLPWLLGATLLFFLAASWRGTPFMRGLRLETRGASTLNNYRGFVA